ncbi:MAG TPA: ATP-binding protein [Allosphingosinicella sp.]|jgi:predicted ATPase with chaperone activity
MPLAQLDLFAGPLFDCAPLSIDRADDARATQTFGTVSHAVEPAPDFAAVHGQETAKRALEIAITGRHAIALHGPSEPCSDARHCRAAALALASGHGLNGRIDILTVGPNRRQLDQFDMHVVLAPVPQIDRRLPPACDTNAVIAARIAPARAILDGWSTSGCPPLTERAERLLDQAEAAWQLSPDRRRRVLAVARTIAALASGLTLDRVHVAEALSYVPADERIA